MESSTIIKCQSDMYATFGTPGFVHSDNGTSLVSEETRKYYLENGIAFSNSTRYNPQGNGQVERYNGIIWKAVQLALYSKNLPISSWEEVLPEALHSVRTLLSTATNETPHERLFSFPRRTAAGVSLPTWLTNKGKVLLKRHVQQSKFEPLCDEVEIIEINPTHATVRYPSGREDSVSLRHLARLPMNNPEIPPSPEVNVSEEPVMPKNDVPALDVTVDVVQPPVQSPSPVTQSVVEEAPAPTIRRSTRMTTKPDYFQAG